MKVGELFIVIDTKLDRFNKGMSDAERAMVKVGKRFTAIGKKMTMMVTLPILALGAAAVKVGADFEQSITNAFSVTGAKSEEVKKQMEDLARTMGEKTVFSAKQAADAMYWMASAGWKIEQMTDALEPTLALAAATQSDLAFATETVITTLKQFGLQASDAGRVSNVFAAAISGSQATLDRLKESLKYIGPMADAMGWSIEDTTAVLSEFYDIGIDASMAGTALRMAFSQLAAGTPKTRKALKELGLTMADVNPETKSLGEIIEVLSSKSMTLAQAIAIFGVRAGPNMLKVLRQGSSAFTEMRDKITDTQAASEMMQKQLDTLSGQWKILTSKLTESAIQISKILIPVLRELIENKLKPAVDWFNNLSEGTKKTAVKIAGLAAVLGPLLLIFGKILIILPKIKLALIALTSPIGLVITGLAFVTIEIIKANKHFKSLTATISEFSEKSGEKISWFKKTLWSLDETFRKFSTGVSNSEIVARKMREEITKLDAKHAEYGKKVWDSIKGTEGFSKASDILNKLLGIQKEAIKKDSEAIEDHGKSTKEAAEETETWIDYIKTIGLKTIKEKSDRVEELEGYVDDLSKAYTAGEISLEDYTKALKAATDEIEDLSTAITTTAIPSFRDMSGVVEQATDEMEDRFFDVSKAIKESTKDAEKSVEKTWDELHPFWSNLCGDLGGSFGNFAESILTTGSNLSDALQRLWGDIKSSFTRMIGDMVAKWMTDFIRNILSSTSDELVPGVTSSLNEIEGSASSAGSAAGTSLTASFATALAVEAVVFTAFLGAVSLLDKLFPKHVKTMAELAAIEAKKAFDKAAKEYSLPGEWGKGGIIAEPEPSGGGQVPAEPEGNYQTGGLVPKTGLAMVHKGEWVIPKISVPLMGFPESMNIQPLREMGIEKRATGESVMYNTVQIYAQKLDDYTIDRAAEKIFAAVERQSIRRRG